MSQCFAQLLDTPYPKIVEFDADASNNKNAATTASTASLPLDAELAATLLESVITAVARCLYGGDLPDASHSETLSLGDAAR